MRCPAGHRASASTTIPALAIAAARRAALRVLYVDLDVHHGDGVQAIHYADPGVLTFSIHESGRTLFPGTGVVEELGDGAAAGTSVNLPLEAGTGDGPWLTGLRALVPALAAAFGPDLIVSQHGADSHAWDPLAHLRVTTTAMGEAARLVDGVAHRHAGGRWLATGGGGYDVYRVVPRAWALTWLAGAHREAPQATDPGWRDRWSADARAYDQDPPPSTFDDPPNAGLPRSELQRLAEVRSLETLARVRATVLPRLLVVAAERGWWDPLVAARGARGGGGPDATGTPTIVASLEPAQVELLAVAPRTIPPFDPGAGRDILMAALRAGGRASGAVLGDRLVGVALLLPAGAGDGDGGDRDELVALGVVPSLRGQGIATALLAALLGSPAATGSARRAVARVSVGERDVVEPLPLDRRLSIATRILGRAGFAAAAPAGRPSGEVFHAG